MRLRNTTLMWFRSDLRVNDNTALHWATRSGPVIGVFLGCREQWQQHGHSANKINFWLRGVADLGGSLARLNIPLLYRDVGHFAEVPETLLGLAHEPGTARSSRLAWNCWTLRNASRRWNSPAIRAPRSLQCPRRSNSSDLPVKHRPPTDCHTFSSSVSDITTKPAITRHCLVPANSLPTSVSA